MFEKEAEAYAIENWEYYEEGKNDSKELKQAYQQGAEFGYNKAFVEADKNLKAIVTDFNKAMEEEYYKDMEEQEERLRQEQIQNYDFEKEAEELEKEKCELLGIIQGKDKVIQELKKELNSVTVSKNQQLIKAREIIKEMLNILPKENIEGVYEITEEAEQFLRENE